MLISCRPMLVDIGLELSIGLGLVVLRRCVEQGIGH